MRELTELQMRKLTRNYKPVRIGPEPESERGPSKVAAPSGSLGVGGGCLWVSASKCLQLALAWEHGAAASADQSAVARTQHMDTFADIHEARAQALMDCCRELRLLTGEESLRQPTDHRQ